MATKKNPKEKFTIMSITIAPTLMELIDKKKGDMNRSKYVVYLLEKVLCNGVEKS